MNQLTQYIKSLTDSELKTACQSFFHKANKTQDPVDMLAYNETFDELKHRLTETEFKVFVINL